MHGITTTAERNAMSAALDQMLVSETEALWNEEVALEVAMCDVGAEQFRAARDKAMQRKQVSHLRPFRALTERMVGPVDEALKGWIAQWSEAGRGRRPVALKYLKDFPADVAALIAIREVLDRSGNAPTSYNPNHEHYEGDAGDTNARSPMKLTAVANAIGMRIQLESRMLAWKKANPSLWKQVQRGLDRQGATAIHKQRVNTYRFNEKVREEIDWKDWPREHVFHVGFALVEQIVVGTGGRVSIIADETAERTAAKHQPPLIIKLDDETTETLFEALDAEESYHTVYMPTVIKPAQWTTMRDGGYHTELLRGRRQLVRFNASHEEQKAVATRELSHVQMQGVYDAINTVQEVPWKINKRVYEVARLLWDNGLDIAGFPRKERIKVDQVLPRPAEADTDQDVEAEWRHKARDLHAENARLPTMRIKTKRTLEIAGRYLNSTFYFPHFLDFRGRMYPIPVDLQPQGQDLARGLLTFAQGKPIDKHSGWWLAVHVANCWGQDKLPFDERVAWVYEHEDMLLSVDADPMADKRWADLPGKKKYWQALAAAFEWARFHREGEGMVSSLPIRVDGTCNGIQHLSAMVRDEEGGASVNLIPDDHPHDIYREVAELLGDMFRMMVDDAGPDAHLAARWLEIVGGQFPRDLLKRPVMIFPYGGSREAYRKYLLLWLRENKVRFPKDIAGKMITLMVNMQWAAVSTQLERPRAVQQWLQVCARLAAASGTPLRWETPVGFVVRHFYGKREARKIETTIDGQRLQLVDWRVTADLDTADHLKGIPPNFTHSMDASVLMTTINRAWQAGVDSITCIHDAYGTVAADMDTLNAHLRESFVWTYQQPILKMFRDQCLEVLDDDYIHREAMPPTPEFGSLDIERVLDSDYFFH